MVSVTFAIDLARLRDTTHLGKKLRKQLLRALFDRYVVIHPTIHPHVPCATFYNNSKQQKAAADAYGAPPQKRGLVQRKQLLHTSFYRHFLIHPTIRSHDPTSTIYIDNKRRNAVADAYRPPPSSSNSLPSSFARNNTFDDATSIIPPLRAHAASLAPSGDVLGDLRVSTSASNLRSHGGALQESAARRDHPPNQRGGGGPLRSDQDARYYKL